MATAPISSLLKTFITSANSSSGNSLVPKPEDVSPKDNEHWVEESSEDQSKPERSSLGYNLQMRLPFKEEAPANPLVDHLTSMVIKTPKHRAVLKKEKQLDELLKQLVDVLIENEERERRISEILIRLFNLKDSNCIRLSSQGSTTTQGYFCRNNTDDGVETPGCGRSDLEDAMAFSNVCDGLGDLSRVKDGPATLVESESGSLGLGNTVQNFDEDAVKLELCDLEREVESCRSLLKNAEKTEKLGMDALEEITEILKNLHLNPEEHEISAAYLK